MIDRTVRKRPTPGTAAARHATARLAVARHTARRLAAALLAAALLLLPACSDTDRPNIFLVTVDTLRADGLHCTGNPLPVSPAVDSLAARGTVFEKCTAHAPSTAPALSALMTSRYPGEVGVLSNLHVLPGEYDTLARAMKRRGYTTAAFVSNFNLREKMGFNRGFDHYDARFTSVEKNRADHPERIARFTTDAALAWLAGAAADDKPLFLWLHYQDPHGPYTPPEEHIPDAGAYDGKRKELPVLPQNWGQGGIPAYQNLEGIRNAADYLARYDGEIAYFDSEFRRVLDALDTAGLTGSTAIVFTADHGESMGERDFWFSHEQHVFSELIQVPLIVALPGGEAARRTDRVCHADILPTIAALGGHEVSPPPEGESPLYRGRNLLDPASGEQVRPIYSETNSLATRTNFKSVIVGKWKLIRRSRMRTKSLLFDIEKDPGELTDLLPTEPDVLRNMVRVLDSEAKKASRRADAPRIDLTPEEREALRALGYLDE